MNQSQRMIEDLSQDFKTGKVIGAAENDADADEIVSRNAIEFTSTGSQNGAKVWKNANMVVASYVRKTPDGGGEVRRHDP